MSPIVEDISRLDELIRDLDDRVETPQGLIREHLTSARSCLIECMPEEYKMMLEMTEQALPLLENPAPKSRIAGFLSHHTAI